MHIEKFLRLSRAERNHILDLMFIDKLALEIRWQGGYDVPTANALAFDIFEGKFELADVITVEVC